MSTVLRDFARMCFQLQIKSARKLISALCCGLTRGVNTLSKMINHFLSRNSKFCMFGVSDHTILTVAAKSYNGTFTAKIDFSIGYFMLPLLPTVANADTGNLKSSHTSLEMFVPNASEILTKSYMVKTTQNFELFDKNKTKQNKTKKRNNFFETVFDKALTPSWKMFL